MSTPQDKIKLIAEGSQLVSVTNQLKLTAADAKKYLADLADTDISQVRNPEGFAESAEVAKEGAKTDKAARLQLEKSTGKPVVSRLNAKKLAAQQLNNEPKGSRDE